MRQNGELAVSTQPKVTDPRQHLALISTPDAADALRKLGVARTVMKGIRPMVRVQGTAAGRARTLRLLPDREDLKTPVNGPVNRGLYDGMQPGEVLVLDAMGAENQAVLGDMMFSRLFAREVSAVVVDGAVRDIPVVSTKGLPVFARSCSPDSYMGFMRPWEADCAIQCGGVLVQPRDFILADADGVVVVPNALARSVAELAQQKMPADAFGQALLAAGFPLDDTYPLPPHMRAFLPAFIENGALPTQDEVRRAREPKA